MVIDSNILIGYLNGDDAIITALNSWKKDSRVLLISAVSFAEVLSYPLLAGKAKGLLARSERISFRFCFDTV